MFDWTLAHRIDEPVISATKKANEMEIVMMSRVLGLRLNAILSEEQGSFDYAAAVEGDANGDMGDRL